MQWTQMLPLPYDIMENIYDPLYLLDNSISDWSAKFDYVVVADSLSAVTR